MSIYKYIYVFFFIGMIGKFYDDITELYLVKNERLIETIKTVWTLLIFYFMAFFTDNKYDIFWMMFVWTFLPLIDWVAFTEDPYFFSLCISISIVGLSILILRNYLTNLKLIYLIPCFIIYLICSPITEIFCFEFNGPLHEFLKLFNIFPNINKFKSVNISDGDLEVSFTKLITRIISIVFLSLMVLIMYFVKLYKDDQELSQLLTSAILLSLCNIGYFILSVINQYYAINFNPELIKKHNLKNKNKEEHTEEHAEEDDKEHK